MVEIGDVVPIGRLEKGDIFRFDPAMADEDPEREYVVVLELRGDPRPWGKVDVTPIGTGLAFPPINSIQASDTVRLVNRVPEWMRPVPVDSLSKGDRFVVPPAPGEAVLPEDYSTILTPAGAGGAKARARTQDGRSFNVPGNIEVIRISPE